MPLTLDWLHYYRALLMIRALSSIGAVLLWLLASIASGAEPGPEPGYVLLRDLSVLRGSVDEEPGGVIIRFQGSEIRLSREKVACWADTLDGLYQFQLDRRRAFTMETHLDAARWCLRHGLCERAAAEIVAAGRLNPGGPDLQRAEAELRLAVERQASERQAMESISSESDPLAADRPTDSGSSGPQTKNDPLASEPLSSDLLRGIGEDELREFNLRIQPLLSNRCSATACHGPGSTASWVLQSEPLPGRRPTAAMTRENLVSVLRWVSRQHPSASPLLVRALKPHGGALEPPLGLRDREAIENLQQWIRSLPSEDSPLVEGAPALAAKDEPSIPSMGPLSGPSMGPLSGPSVGPLSGPAVGRSAQPMRLPTVADPFDPDLFNRRYHPEMKSVGMLPPTSPR